MGFFVGGKTGRYRSVGGLVLALCVSADVFAQSSPGAVGAAKGGAEIASFKVQPIRASQELAKLARGSAVESEPTSLLQPEALSKPQPGSEAKASPEPNTVVKKKASTPNTGPAERSAFELQLEQYTDPLVGTPIVQFGYDVFARKQAPLTDSPVGSDYVLGVGDSLIVNLWGALVDEDHRVAIDRDGEVRLPEVGVVALKGLSLASAEGLLKRKFDKVYKNYNMELRLGRVREMSVHVIGRVAEPGRVRVSSISTLFEALEAAGGVSKDGTLRNLVLRRRGAEPRRVDLYSYLLEGDLSVDVTLSPNDTVVVPAVGPRVAITGRVLRPAIYELGSEEVRFSSLLEMAGGYGRLADRHTLQVESHLANGLAARSVDLKMTPPQDVTVKDGDVAIVVGASPKVDNVVYLAGNVAKPGRYAYREGMRVADVVTEETLIEAGFWLSRAPPGASEPLTLPEPFLDYALIQRIGRSQQEARITFNLGSAIFEHDPAENHLLQPQDTIIVYPRSEFVQPQTVFVAGPVNRPDDYPFYPGMAIRDLVRMAGGLLPQAHLESAILTRIIPEQEGARFENINLHIGDAMSGQAGANLLLEPGDGVSLKTVPGYRKLYRVEITGELLQPGTYTVIPGERLSDLLRRAGGFTENAYLPAAQLYRQSVQQLQQARIEESLRRLQLEGEAAAQQFTAESVALGDDTVDVDEEKSRVAKLINTIRNTAAKGRMVIRVSPPDSLVGTPHDVELQDGDRLLVPRIPQEVNVVGAVFNQTALLHGEELLVREYLSECGGPTQTADMSVAYIVRADGTTDSARSARRNYRWDGDRGRYSKGGFLDAKLYPGDTVVVPYDVKPHVSKLGLTKTITQILFQTALATGVIVALL